MKHTLYSTKPVQQTLTNWLFTLLLLIIPLTAIYATSNEGKDPSNEYRYLKYTVTAADNHKMIEHDWLVGNSTYPASNLTSNNSGGVVVSGSFGDLNYRIYDGDLTGPNGLWVGEVKNTAEEKHIILDLGASKPAPTAIRIQKKSWGNLKGFKCEGSTDGKTWVVLLTNTSSAGTWTDKTFQLDTPTATTYALTVNLGKGSGNYKKGDKVTITANEADSGKEFDKWDGDGANNISDINK